MKNNNFGVIMAGGIGSRFWPLSTTEFPKQFHDILGTGRTFLQQTFDRLAKFIPKDQIFIVTLQEYVELTLNQLPEIFENQIIAEPKGMNTSPCNLYAALLIREINPEANIVVAPSDHIVLDEKVFREKIEFALSESEKKPILVTLGIEPTRPDTGYGYIQYFEDEKTEIKKVKTFTEKPGIELAEAFIKSGDFLWNAGIFVWKAKSIIDSFQQHLPEMFESFTKIKSPLLSNEGTNEMRELYSTVQFISVDNGILEKADNVFVIPSSFGWSDLGTWKSLFENSKKDKQNNVKRGKPILTYNSRNSLIYSSQNKAVIVDGLDDYIVVDTENALLICPIDKDQTIKTFVSDLKLNKGEQFV